jgi:NlpC/P60 family putative phage cell wall peptidase
MTEDAAMRERVVAIARSWIGTPYLHQASLKGAGCDCLGLVRGIWRELYGAEPEAMPAYSPDWAEAGGRETLADAARRHMMECARDEQGEGLLLLCRFRLHLPARHAVISAPGNMMIHAQEGAGVCEVPLSPWWRRRVAFAFAFAFPDI